MQTKKAKSRCVTEHFIRVPWKSLMKRIKIEKKQRTTGQVDLIYTPSVSSKPFNFGCYVKREMKNKSASLICTTTRVGQYQQCLKKYFHLLLLNALHQHYSKCDVWYITCSLCIITCKTCWFQPSSLIFTFSNCTQAQMMISHYCIFTFYSFYSVRLRRTHIHAPVEDGWWGINDTMSF